MTYFVAAESNGLMLAIFKFGVYYFCVRVCVGRGREMHSGCLLKSLLLIPWGLQRDTGCCSFGSVPRADATPQVAFSTVGQSMNVNRG